MDSQGFDRITRRWASSTPRRTLLGALIAGAIGLAGEQRSGVKGKNKKKKKVTLCLNGQTISVKKSQKGTLLRQGASQGACAGSPPASPPGSPPASLPSPPGPPPPSPGACRDGIKNGDETAVDCGGHICPPCGSGKACKKDVDCFSGVCNFDLGNCNICRAQSDCSSDFNGACRCDFSSGNCFTDLEPSSFVDSCNECDPELVCVSFFEGLACMPRCESSEICGTADLCRGNQAFCGHGGACLQPLGGGPTRCGVSARKCGCASHQECKNLFDVRAFCVQFNPNLGDCTCGEGMTTFCAIAV